jgi:hypothetical protein
VLGIERRQLEIGVIAQIVADRGLPGDESASLRRGHVGARDDISNDTRVPAVSGFDKKIVLFGAVTAHLGERHAEAFGTDPRRFRQDFQHIALAKGKAAEVSDRCLLAKKLADLCDVFLHIRTAWGPTAGCSRWNPCGNGGRALPVATIPATISRPRSRLTER